MDIKLIGASGKPSPSQYGRIDPNALLGSINAVNPSQKQVAIQRGNIQSVDYNNPNDVRTAVSNLKSFKNPSDQMRILQHATRLGLVDKNKANKAIIAIGNQGPTQPNLTPFEQLSAGIVNGVSGLGKAIIDPTLEAGRMVSNFIPMITADVSGNAKMQKQVRQDTFGTNNDKAIAGKIVGDTAQVGSMLIGAPELSVALRGGTSAAKAAGVMGLSGALGGEGSALSNGEDIKQQLISTLAGAALGEIPLGGALLRKGTSSVAGKIVDSGLPDAIAPYTSKIDQVTKDALSKGGKVVKNAVELLPGGKKLTGALGKVNDVVQQKAITSLHNITKPIAKSDIPTVQKQALLGKIDELRANMFRSNTRASETIKTDPRIAELRQNVISLAKSNKEAQKAASDYVNAKEELNRINSGVAKAAPERVAGFKQQITQLESKYGKDKLQAVHKSFIKAQGIRNDILKGVGATDEQFARWQEQNPEYIRLQREQNPNKMEPYNVKGSSGNTNQLSQKINPYATGKAHDAFATLIDSVHQAHQFRAQQEFAHGIIDSYKKAGIPLRALNTTERTLTRKEIISGLKASKETKDQLETLAKYHRGAIKTLSKDMKSLNDKGVKKMFAKSEDIKNYMIRKSTGTSLAGSGSKVLGPIDNPEELLHQYINSPDGGFRDILNKMAAKNEKIASLRDDLETISKTLTAVKTKRAADYLKAQGLAAEPARGTPTITYYDKGVKNVYRVPKDVRQAFDHLTAPQQTSLAKAARVVNNVFKYGTTQGNPVFAFKNIIRDQLTSAINSESVWSTHNPAVFMDALYNSITGKSADFQRFIREYAGEANFVNVNRNPLKATAEARKVLNQGRQGVEKLTSNSAPIVVKDGVKLAAHGFNELVNKLENLTRYQNYKGTYNFYLKKMNPLTGSKYTDAEAHMMALRAARRNSTDFSDAGDFGRVMNNYVPYFNAALQGTRTLGRAIRERPATTTAKLLTATSPVVGLTYWNLSSPQNAAVYANVPDYQKQSNFVIVVGGNAFLIPMSQEFQAAAGIPRVVMEAKFGSKPLDFMTEAGNFVKALSPVNANTWPGVAAGMLPPQLRSLIETGANYNFYTGQQIVPDYVKAQNQDPTQQVYRDKNGKPIGSGGIETGIAKALGVSPLDVQYFLKNALGTAVGENGLDAANSATGLPSSGQDLGSSFKRSFMSSGKNVSNEFNNVYYPLSDSRNYKQKQINTLLYNGKIAQAQRVATEWNQYVDKQFTPYYKQYGPYVDQNVTAAKDRIGNLKFNIKVSKKGRGYIR